MHASLSGAPRDAACILLHRAARREKPNGGIAVRTLPSVPMTDERTRRAAVRPPRGTPRLGKEKNTVRSRALRCAERQGKRKTHGGPAVCIPTFA